MPRLFKYIKSLETLVLITGFIGQTGRCNITTHNQRSTLHNFMKLFMNMKFYEYSLESKQEGRFHVCVVKTDAQHNVFW